MAVARFVAEQARLAGALACPLELVATLGWLWATLGILEGPGMSKTALITTLA